MPEIFGHLPDHSPVFMIPITHKNLSAKIITYGAIIQSLNHSRYAHTLVLAFDDLEGYIQDTESVGALCGPVINRIADAQFSIDGTAYHVDANIEGGHCLHSGSARLSKVNWGIADHGPAHVTLTHHQKDGVGGFPGPVDYRVTYRLDDDGLTVTINAQPHQKTPLCLAQHSYFNLDKAPSIRESRVTIHADHILETGAGIIPTGNLIALDNHPLDFRAGKSLNAVQCALDHTFIPAPAPKHESEDTPLRKIAQITPSGDGPNMEISTDQSALQLYDAAHLTAPFTAHQGVCFECHGHPNALNIPSFPTMIYGPDRPYRAVTRYGFMADVDISQSDEETAHLLGNTHNATRLAEALEQVKDNSLQSHGLIEE